MIPLTKPKIGLAERRAVDKVLRSGMLAQGSEVQAFEREFSEQLAHGRPVVAVNSGTSGLHLGLLATGMKPGDEVIVPSFTFAASPNSIVLAGGKPVFCDIDPKTFTMNVDGLRSLISPRTRGIMPVHLYGHPADMEKIMPVAQEHGLWVAEDAAQAHGASLNRQMVGTFGDFGVFSLYPTKNMTSGEGGMVSLASLEAARYLRLLRNQGMEVKYQNEIVGFNNRMTDIHAAIGRAQLRKLAHWTALRQANAAYLNSRISAAVTPFTAPGAVHVFHQYTIRVPDDRDGFANALREEFSVGTGVYYPPAHMLKSLKNFAIFHDLSETELASKEVLSLPIYPGLSRRKLDQIALGVNQLLEAGR